MLHRLAHIHIFHNVYRYMFVLFKHKKFHKQQQPKNLICVLFQGTHYGGKRKRFFLAYVMVPGFGASGMGGGRDKEIRNGMVDTL